MSRLDEVRGRLRRIGQDHVLQHEDELSDAQIHAFVDQLASLDLESIPRWVEEYVRKRPASGAPADLSPALAYPRDPRSPGDPSRAWAREDALRRGEDLVRSGRVAVFTVAGGQGSRLGFDGPKGVYPAGAVTGKPLFACIAEWIIAARRRYGAPIPWLVMTSPLNHKDTVAFFEAHGHCGLPKDDVIFFQQGVMPSFDAHTGRLLLARKGEVATNPDGHGGSLRALHASGALAELKRRGVEHISYTQIDNPLVRAVDPVFIGLHAGAPDSSGEMSSKMVPKTHPGEKVGVFCRAGGRTMVIEYSDMPEALSKATNADGSLRFNAGSIAVHVIGRAFIERLNQGDFALPFHRADKQIPHVDLNSGEVVQPAAPNGVKLEAFVFDAIPLCRSSIVLETDRVEEFAPIKNAEGADSPKSCREIQTERAARWLEGAGVKVARRADGLADCVLEISPLTAMWAEDLRGRPGLPARIEPGQKLAL
ncbi:MAG: UDPGP type 1 family protein [Phycisphaerales bacterium]|nr:UDPGP type 1 family protein [Phycisphaerales bacterium]